MLKLSGTAGENEILHKVATLSLKMVFRNKILAQIINISVMRSLQNYSKKNIFQNSDFIMECDILIQNI